MIRDVLAVLRDRVNVVDHRAAVIIHHVIKLQRSETNQNRCLHQSEENGAQLKHHRHARSQPKERDRRQSKDSQSHDQNRLIVLLFNLQNVRHQVSLPKRNGINLLNNILIFVCQFVSR